jgi:hypothetical protein
MLRALFFSSPSTHHSHRHAADKWARHGGHALPIFRLFLILLCLVSCILVSPPHARIPQYLVLQRVDFEALLPTTHTI